MRTCVWNPQTHEKPPWENTSVIPVWTHGKPAWEHTSVMPALLPWDGKQKQENLPEALGSESEVHATMIKRPCFITGGEQRSETWNCPLTFTQTLWHVCAYTYTHIIPHVPYIYTHTIHIHTWVTWDRRLQLEDTEDTVGLPKNSIIKASPVRAKTYGHSQVLGILWYILNRVDIQNIMCEWLNVWPTLSFSSWFC